ncbi:protocadherin-like wing polarity protein stan isoform X7 [Carassius gibelio]|uniref:protocadherin-like wing polarity protein stan isoform X3 n=1 Tax=Carassius gibelio TaxID=101364 RepID=UPI0022798340|nr:protocadherin-like wing polarity protein stan isoform X3 [Carassius gibelio]XP_052473437.1 protocadherin-like wing polarity protein stan isoform X7 [Carassius gibelio]
MALFCVLVILACLHVDSVRSAIGSTEVNCGSGSNVALGRVEEGFEGDIEIITNISPDVRLVLEPYRCSICLQYLELVYSDGDSTATVRTIKPLDLEEIKPSADALYYSVSCVRGAKNIRSLYVLDINDNPPIFQTNSYTGTVSDGTPVGWVCQRVKAIDKDATTENKRVTYSMLPPVPEHFGVRYNPQYDAADIELIKPVNYNDVKKYVFMVEAKDIGGLRDTTTITLTIVDFDNLNPYFDHCLYKASIEENQVGLFSDITPEPIKAQDGDTGINEPVVYSITSVIPNEYQNSFEIDRNTGVISVTAALDREQTGQIAVVIQATQQNDASKTADAVVLVTIVDVTDNPPKIDQGVHSSHLA